MRKNCSSDQFEAKGREVAKQFIQTRSEQFLKQNAFLGFLRSNKLEQFKFKSEKIIRI